MEACHFRDWVLSRRVMCALFWSAVTLLFTGIILLVISKHRGSGYRSWGAVLLALGFCALLGFLLLCLHAFWIITRHDKEEEPAVHAPLDNGMIPNGRLTNGYPLEEQQALKVEAQINYDQVRQAQHEDEASRQVQLLASLDCPPAFSARYKNAYQQVDPRGMSHNSMDDTLYSTGDGGPHYGCDDIIPKYNTGDINGQYSTDDVITQYGKLDDDVQSPQTSDSIDSDAGFSVMTPVDERNLRDARNMERVPNITLYSGTDTIHPGYEPVQPRTNSLKMHNIHADFEYKYSHRYVMDEMRERQKTKHVHYADSPGPVIEKRDRQLYDDGTYDNFRSDSISRKFPQPSSKKSFAPPPPSVTPPIPSALINPWLNTLHNPLLGPQPRKKLARSSLSSLSSQASLQRIPINHTPPPQRHPNITPQGAQPRHTFTNQPPLGAPLCSPIPLRPSTAPSPMTSRITSSLTRVTPPRGTSHNSITSPHVMTSSQMSASARRQEEPVVVILNPLEFSDSALSVYDNVPRQIPKLEPYVPYSEGSTTYCDI